MDDESINMVIPIIKMISAHSLDPYFYKYGTLIHYFTMPLYEVYFHFKNISPLPPPSLDFLTPALYYIGRYESAVFDILTILITYKIAERLFDRRVAFVAVLFMTINPLELLMAHLFKPDTFMTFFAMCVFYFSIRLKEENKLRWYVLAGIFSGFAMSTRLDFFVLVMPVTGWFLYMYRYHVSETIEKRKMTRLIVFFLAACMSFCLTSPYLVWHIPEFLHATVHEFTHAQHIDLVNDIFHKRFIAQSIIVFPFILSFSVYCLSFYGFSEYIKKRGGYETLFYSLYPFLYFITVTIVSDRPSYADGGYFYLAILPFFIMLGAYGVTQLWDKIRRKGIRSVIALIVCIDILSASGTFVNSLYTYNRLGEWVNRNIPRNSSILIMNSFRPVFLQKYYVYPIYTETIKWSPPLQYSLKVINPDFVIANGFDIYLEGGYTYFSRLMEENHFHQVKLFMPQCTPYRDLFSPFIPDVNRGTLYVYKDH